MHYLVARIQCRPFPLPHLFTDEASYGAKLILSADKKKICMTPEKYVPLFVGANGLFVLYPDFQPTH